MAEQIKDVVSHTAKAVAKFSLPSSDCDYLNEEGVAGELRVSVRTIQRWRATGEGPPFIRAGARRVIYARAAIKQWAAARTFAHRAAELSRTAA